MTSHKIPRYNDMISFLNSSKDTIAIASLYRQLFDHEVPSLRTLCDPLDLHEALARMVNQNLFPLDLHAFDLYEDRGDELGLDAPVLVKGEGIPLNAVGLEGISKAVEPLVYALLPALQHYKDFALPGPEYLDQMYLGYWHAHGFDRPPSLTWARSKSWIIKDLVSGLPAPFNGLATLFDCIWRISDNPFIDWSSETIFEDYCERGSGWVWTYDSIMDLAYLYEQKRKAIKELHAYYRWCEWPSNDMNKVVRALLDLEWMYQYA